MPAPPRLRTAVLIHGLGLLVIAAGAVTRWALGFSSDAGHTFFITGLVTGCVAIVWSISLAMRAVAGSDETQHARRLKLQSAAFIGFSLVELNVVAWIGWAWAAREPWAASARWLGMLDVVAISGFPVFAPVGTALLLMWLLFQFARRSQHVWRRRLAMGLCGAAAALLLLIVLPCQLWVLGAAVRMETPGGWNNFMNAALPDALKVATEKACADGWSKWARDFRPALCRYGRLPVWRLEQNLTENNEIASACWGSLETHPDDQLRIAKAAAQSAMPINLVLNDRCVFLIAERLSASELEEFLGDYDRVPASMRADFRTALYKSFAALAEPATIDDIEWKKSEIYKASLCRRDLKLVMYAHDSDPYIRRLATTELAAILGEKLQATPHPGARDAQGVTLEEAEEAAHILDRARTAHSMDELRKSINLCENEIEVQFRLDWFWKCFPEGGQAYAKTLTVVGESGSVGRSMQRSYGQYGRAEDIHSMLKQVAEPETEPRLYLVDRYKLACFLDGIAAGERTDFIDDIKALTFSVNGEPPAMDMRASLESALFGLLPRKEVDARFEAWLSGSEGQAGLLSAAKRLWDVHDEAQRLEFARRMMKLPDADDRQIVFVNAKTLSPLSLHDPKLRMAWAETMTALLDDPDLLVRRAAAYAVADYYRFGFSSMPKPIPNQPAMSESIILTAARNEPETEREKIEMNALRERIDANKKLKASRKIARPDVRAP